MVFFTADSQAVLLHMKEIDTKEGITKSLSSLEEFNALIKQRHDAYYLRKENLNQFIVKGKLVLDSCGNCCEIYGDIKVTDPVISLQEYTGDLSYMYNHNIPPARIICPICKKNWSTENMHDCKVENKSLILKNFSGQTIESVKTHLDSLNDAIYIIHFDRSIIRNDKHIDLTPDKEYPSLVLNEFGWINVRPDYVILPDDEVSCDSWVYYHTSCLSKKVELEAQSLIESGGKDYNHIYNLAGDKNCDHWIKAELTLAGIEIVPERCKGEVPYTFEGRLGKNGEFTFERAWTYWVVNGEVPLSIAEELYADPEGRKYVRVAGHCGCPPPAEWASLNTKGKPVVDVYHIDTLKGLKLFAEKIKKVLG